MADNSRRVLRPTITTAIVLPISRDQFLPRVFVSHEHLDCGPARPTCRSTSTAFPIGGSRLSASPTSVHSSHKPARSDHIPSSDSTSSRVHSIFVPELTAHPSSWPQSGELAAQQRALCHRWSHASRVAGQRLHQALSVERSMRTMCSWR